jgi:hypothetical protein
MLLNARCGELTKGLVLLAVRTLAVCAESSPFTVSLKERHRARLASMFSLVRVPSRHDVPRESAEETDPLPGYIDASGVLQPLL